MSRKTERRVSHNAHARTYAPARINVAALLIACGSKTGIKVCRQKQGEQANTAQNQKKQNWTSQTRRTRWRKERKSRPESARRSKKPEKISTVASAVTKRSRRCVHRCACVYVYLCGRAWCACVCVRASVWPCFHSHRALEQNNALEHACAEVRVMA